MISFKKKSIGISILSFCLSLCLSFVFNSSFAQSKFPQKSKVDAWKTTFESNLGKTFSSKINQGNLHIVAVMVEFQPDSNRFTTGNGTFNPTFLDTASIIIDPLPHNKTYFEAHLKFVKHYFETASKGKLTVSYQVIPTVYRLDKEMAAYSPTGFDSNNDFKLGLFLKDTWEMVNQDNSVSTVNWNDDTAFLVFHAGSGRDFDFLNTTLDRTPQDIPSLYLNQTSISKLLNEPSFSGFSVKGFQIKNSGIMPETESRKGEFLDTPYVLQLGINGLLTAIVGNHIGLPDLYNTSTGNSAIGRFGLMDPEGFFAYFGLFPPLPSAWERLYMGWDQAKTVMSISEDKTYSLQAVSLNPIEGIVKIPISSDEYFLVENRNRNAANSGITITIQAPDGTSSTQTYTNADTRFTAQNLDSLINILPKGVITATTNYDWALPGGLDAGKDGKYFTSDDRELNGGFLIWHIDESVIRQNLRSNTINANILRKGIDLEEADGAQDIGNATNNLFLESVVGGTSFDFWWSGNNYTVITQQGDSLRSYVNRFAPNTRPSTTSNTGAYVPIELYNFSDALPASSFKLRAFSGQIKHDVRFEDRRILAQTTQGISNIDYPLHPIVFTQNADSVLLVPSENGFFAFPFNPTISSTTLASSVFRQPILYGTQVIVATTSTKVEAFSYQNPIWVKDWSVDLSESIKGMISITSGKVDIENSAASIDLLTGNLVLDFQKPRIHSEIINGKQAILSENVLEFDQKTYSIPSIELASERILLGIHQFGADYILVLDTDNITFVIRDNEIRQIPSSKTLGSIYYNPSQVEPIFLQTDSTLNGNFLNGTVASGYPLSVYDRSLSGTPLLVDLDGDGSQERIVIESDSLQTRVAAYYQNDEPVPGFPLLAGSKTAKTMIHPYFDSKRLWIVSTDGFVFSWLFPNSGEAHWKSPYGNSLDGKLSTQISEAKTYQNGTSLLNKSETYNWPNPAQDHTTIRFQTIEQATVSVDIYTLSGLKVWSKQNLSMGFAPEEISLNTSSWGSGLYYIRIKATSATKTDSKIVKMVVEH